jgi:RHS repeat-associated protein
LLSLGSGAFGSTPTKYQYSGQYSFVGEFGLLDFKARYYDPQLGRFAAPDTIVPQGQGAQAWDRYAYVYYTQGHILLNTALYELIRFFGFGWTS